MMLVDLLLATPLLLMGVVALPGIAQDVRRGDRSQAGAGAFLFLSWTLPGCALVAHAMVRT